MDLTYTNTLNWLCGVTTTTSADVTIYRVGYNCILQVITSSFVNTGTLTGPHQLTITSVPTTLQPTISTINSMVNHELTYADLSVLSMVDNATLTVSGSSLILTVDIGHLNAGTEQILPISIHYVATASLPYNNPPTLTAIGPVGLQGNSAYRLYVGTHGKYATLKEAVDWYNSNATTNYEIILDGGNTVVSDTVVIDNTSYTLTIRGQSSQASFVVPTTGMTSKPIFEVRSPVFFFNVSGDGSTLASYGTLAGENFVTFSTNDSTYHEFQSFSLNNFYVGLYDPIGVSFFAFNFIISDCVTGIQINYSTVTGSDQSIDIETGNFDNCTTGISLKKTGALQSFLLINLLFTSTVGQTGIDYTPNTASNGYQYGTIALITGCSWNRLGTFVSGVDFTTQRDSNILIAQNLGISDYNAYARIVMTNNATITTVTTAGTYYKVNGTNTFSFTNKFGIGNNSLTYYPNYPSNMVANIAGSVTTSSKNRTVTVGLRKGLSVSTVTGNGATVTVTTSTNHNIISNQIVQMLGWTGGTGTWNGVFTITVTGLTTFTYTSTGNGTATGGTSGVIFGTIQTQVTTSSIPFPYFVQAVLQNLQVNEVCELYVTSSSSGDDVTVSIANWLINVI